MRLKIVATTQYTYPDISGLCDAPHLTDDHLDTYTNPLFIIEVLSPSTERYDRGPKFDGYKTIPTLQDYVLISQHHPLVEHYRRDGDNWIHASAAHPDASIHLPSIDCTLSLTDIYEKVTFEN
jgi:Uma2 family endonuclease